MNQNLLLFICTLFLMSCNNTLDLKFSCLNKLNLQLGDNISEEVRSKYISDPKLMRTFKSIELTIGKEETNPKFQKFVEFQLDDSNIINRISYAILNIPIGGNDLDFNIYSDSICNKYFDCIPGFKQSLNLKNGKSKTFEEGNFKIKKDLITNGIKISFERLN